MKNFELANNTEPFYVTQRVYNNLPQFVFSDTKKRIRIGDQIAWILMDISPIKLLNGGICKQQLMLVNWEEINIA